jgi:predicted nucleotidyltransferase
MRLTHRQQEIIREEVARIFGESAHVRLFGSRVDDKARGGDIDLYIESSGTPAELLDRELRLQARLLRGLGDRRIDIVVYSGQGPLRPIDIEAQKTGVPI